MTKRHVRVVSLWIHPGQAAAFEDFERQAARIMSVHGGLIDAAVRLTPDEARPDAPYEIHVVSFPDAAAAEAYAADPQTIALRAGRAAIIARTELAAGVQAGPY